MNDPPRQADGAQSQAGYPGATGHAGQYGQPGQFGPGFGAAPSGAAPSGAPHGPSGLAAFFEWIRSARLTRSSDRWVAGVCGGIGERLGVSPLLVRALMLGAVLLGGLGAACYAIAWALMPDRETGDSIAERLAAGRLDWSMLGVLLCLVVALVLPGVGVVAFALALLGGFVLMQWCRRHDVVAGWATPATPTAPIAPTAPAGPQWTAPAAQGPSATSAPYDPSAPYAPPTQFAASAQVPAYAAAPATAPHAAAAAPPRPRIVRRRPAGFVLVLAVIGLIMVSGAAAVLDVLRADVTLTHQVRGLLVWSAGVCLALGLIVTVLGCMGRRAGGLIPVGLVAAAVTVCVVAASGVLSYSWRRYDALAAGMERVAVGDYLTIGSTPDQMARLIGGVSFDGRDDPWIVELHDGDGYYYSATYGRDNSSDVNIDLTGYERDNGTHDVTLNDGTTRPSGCPTGTIRLAARFTDVTVTLPDGCSYRLDALKRYGCYAEDWKRNDEGARERLLEGCSYGWVSAGLVNDAIWPRNQHVESRYATVEHDGESYDDYDNEILTPEPHYEWLQDRAQDPAEPELVIKTPALMFAAVSVVYQSDSTLPGYND